MHDFVEYICMWTASFYPIFKKIYTHIKILYIPIQLWICVNAMIGLSLSLSHIWVVTLCRHQTIPACTIHPSFPSFSSHTLSLSHMSSHCCWHQCNYMRDTICVWVPCITLIPPHEGRQRTGTTIHEQTEKKKIQLLKNKHFLSSVRVVSESNLLN